MKSLDNIENTGVLGIVTLIAPNFNINFDIFYHTASVSIFCFNNEQH